MDNHEKALATYKALKKRKEKRARKKEMDADSFHIERTEFCKKMRHDRKK